MQEKHVDMNAGEVQAQAIARLKRGDPSGAARLLASNEPLTSFFRGQLASLLQPGKVLWEKEADEPDCRLVIKKFPGRPRTAAVNAEEVWLLVDHSLRNRNTLQQAIGIAADKLSLSDKMARKLYYQINLLKREEEEDKNSTWFSADGPLLSQEEVDEILQERHLERQSRRRRRL